MHSTFDFQRKKLETKLNKELEETQAVESKQKIQRNVCVYLQTFSLKSFHLC